MLFYTIGEVNMGIVNTEITLKNATDLIKVMDGLIKEQDVHETTVVAVADTGAMSNIINLRKIS
jgi:hypothetical protein